MIISYPTITSGIIILLKNVPKYLKLKSGKSAQKILRKLTIFVEHGIVACMP